MNATAVAKIATVIVTAIAKIIATAAAGMTVAIAEIKSAIVISRQKQVNIRKNNAILFALFFLMCYNAKRFNTHPKGSVLLCGRQNQFIGRPNGIRDDSRGGTTGGKKP